MCVCERKRGLEFSDEKKKEKKNERIGKKKKANNVCQHVQPNRNRVRDTDVEHEQT